MNEENDIVTITQEPIIEESDAQITQELGVNEKIDVVVVTQ